MNDAHESTKAAGPGAQEVLRLCYLRHAFGLGEHYNSVEPKAFEIAETL